MSYLFVLAWWWWLLVIFVVTSLPRTASSARWRLSAIHNFAFLAQSAIVKCWWWISSTSKKWQSSSSFERMKSASQVGQEIYILDHVIPLLVVASSSSSSTMIVLEIGAFDGLHLSNTLVFERRLCSFKVVHIEGNPIAFEKLQKNRPRCHNVCALCSNNRTPHHCYRVFTVAGSCSGIESTLTGYSREKKKLKKFADAKDLLLPLRRTQDVIDAVVLEHDNKRKIDVAFLDVEGHELEVLNGLDWTSSYLLPSCWCVEFCEASDPDRLRQVDDILVNRGGYLCVHEFSFGDTTEHRGSKSCDRLYLHHSLLWAGAILSQIERARILCGELLIF